jgi:mRNA-degrading endonuclease RelE of RelBE toxin-antitoxin system
MATSVTIPPQFRKRLERYARKSKSIVLEVEGLVGILENDERPGDKIPHVGYDVYKVRLKNPSAKKGKSKGFRVVYYIRRHDYVILVTLYSKSEATDIDPKEIKRRIDDILKSLGEDDNGE